MTTRRYAHESKLRPELDELLERSNKAWDEMTPIQRANMMWHQRVSWTYGNLALDGVNVSREDVYRRAVEQYGPPPGEDP